jgi:multidrug resistance efflux pump
MVPVKIRRSIEKNWGRSPCRGRPKMTLRSSSVRLRVRNPSGLYHVSSSPPYRPPKHRSPGEEPSRSFYGRCRVDLRRWRSFLSRCSSHLWCGTIAPWTRDGRVRVQVASVAPRVSGQITQLRVADNQFVHKGDVLYQIEPFDFDVALRLSKALLEQREADSYVKELQSERRERLSELSTSREQQQVFEGSARQAKAAVDAAREQVAQADINLKRTEVRSPVNGYVTNLLLRVGDYAHEGVSNISIVDTDSFWVDGYFEETKLAQMCIGDRAEVKLMDYAAPIIGHVTTITRGVSVSNGAAGVQGLPSVAPVYTWVRLAQRVPVRIAIDRVPPGIPLVSGMTGTVTSRDDSRAEEKTWLYRAKVVLRTSLSHIMGGVSPQPRCIASKT